MRVYSLTSLTQTQLVHHHVLQACTLTPPSPLLWPRPAVSVHSVPTGYPPRLNSWISVLLPPFLPLLPLLPTQGPRLLLLPSLPDPSKWFAVTTGSGCSDGHPLLRRSVVVVATGGRHLPCLMTTITVIVFLFLLIVPQGQVWMLLDIGCIWGGIHFITSYSCLMDTVRGFNCIRTTCVVFCVYFYRTTHHFPGSGLFHSPWDRGQYLAWSTLQVM